MVKKSSVERDLDNAHMLSCRVAWLLISQIVRRRLRRAAVEEALNKTEELSKILRRLIG